MTLNHGREYVAIPGPSVVPDQVLRAMHRASPNIYSGEIVDVFHNILDGLKLVAGTSDHATLYVSNGHGAWEASLSNTLSKGERDSGPVNRNVCQRLGWIRRAVGG